MAAIWYGVGGKEIKFNHVTVGPTELSVEEKQNETDSQRAKGQKSADIRDPETTKRERLRFPFFRTWLYISTLFQLISLFSKQK